MKGIVWCVRTEEGNAELDRIIQEYLIYNIKIKKHSKSIYGDRVEFENDDTWLVVSAKESARGHKAQIAHVQRSIDWNTYSSVIIPCSSTGPFNAISFWGKGNLHVTDIIDKKSECVELVNERALPVDQKLKALDDAIANIKSVKAHMLEDVIYCTTCNKYYDKEKRRLQTQTIEKTICINPLTGGYLDPYEYEKKSVREYRWTCPEGHPLTEWSEWI